MTSANGRIPMDLTDPYYGQFWPDGVVLAQSSRDALGHSETPFGCVGTYTVAAMVASTLAPGPALPVDVVGAALRSYRQTLRINMATLSRMMGKNVQYVWKIENACHRTVHRDGLETAVNRLGITLDELLAYADKA